MSDKFEDIHSDSLSNQNDELNNNTTSPIEQTESTNITEETSVSEKTAETESPVQQEASPQNFADNNIYPQNSHQTSPYIHQSLNYQPLYPQNNIPPYNRNFNQGYNPNINYPYNPAQNPMYSEPLPPFPPQNNNNKPPKKNSGLKVALLCVSSVLAIVSIAFVLVIVQSGLSGDTNIITGQNSTQAQESSYGTASKLPDAPDVSADENGPQISTQETSDSVTASTANKAYKKMSPSVVCITSYEAGSDYTLTESGEGSGIIITADGYIATNSHVVNDSTKTGVMITLSTGDQYLGTVIGIDKKTDLAVIKISADNLTSADFADSDKLVVGQEVYAIGNPGGSAFSNSLTTGSVSALNRVLSSNAYVRYIQTDAAINPGNSGGALVNEYGQVIGINTAKLVGTDYEGMGFAIPSNTVTEIINKLIKYGYVNDRGTLGIEGKTCTLYASKVNNVPQGMIITKISSGSSLYSSQAKEGDIITAINGTEIKNSTEFIDQLRDFKPDDTITLTIFRTKENTSGQPYTYTVTATLIAETGE